MRLTESMLREVLLFLQWHFCEFNQYQWDHINTDRYWTKSDHIRKETKHKIISSIVLLQGRMSICNCYLSGRILKILIQFYEDWIMLLTAAIVLHLSSKASPTFVSKKLTAVILTVEKTAPYSWDLNFEDQVIFK